MQSLKHIRVVISLVMLLECASWVVWGLSAPAHTQAARMLQVVPSLLGATLSAGVLWLLVTLLAGRFYCAAFCPVGTLQDILIRLHIMARRRRGTRPFRFHEPRPWRYAALGVYIAAVVAGIGAVPLLLDPWPAFSNALSFASGAGLRQGLAYLGVGAGIGAVCAVLSALLLAVYALWRGRDFCNDLCPVGILLEPVARVAAFHLELVPDRCTSCLRCEDVCKASCISIKTRRIDNGRCIRCMDCLAACPDGAIRFTASRTGIISPLMQRRRGAAT